MAEDILIKNSLIFTMQGEGLGVRENGTVYIEGKNISFVGPADQFRLEPKPDLVIDGKNRKAVLPGFIDAHLHSSEALLRGLAQDVPESEWMHKTIDPLKQKMTEDDLIQGTKLSILEAINHGTTTFTDYGHPIKPLIEKVYRPLKLRLVAVPKINALPSGTRLDPKSQYPFDIKRGEKLFDRARGLVKELDGSDRQRVKFMVGPQSADMLPASLLEEVFNFAESQDLMVHMHVAQGGRERRQMEMRYGQSTVSFLQNNNLLSDNLLAAHCHDTTREELQILAKSGAKMVSCPSSIAMIDGIVPPLAEYLRLGGVACLGSDQAAGNNNQSILAELKTTALLNKVRDADPTSLKAWQLLRLATIEGAKALGIDNWVGSLKEGKRADLIVFDLQNPTLAPNLKYPLRNLAHNIVYASRGSEIDLVLIDGNVVKKDSRLTILDEDKTLIGAQKAAKNLAQRAGEEYISAGSEMVKDFQKGLF